MSFENILLHHNAHFQHQCVWNTIDVVHNNMNPRGMLQHWYREGEQDPKHHLSETGSKFCTLIKDPADRGQVADPGHGLWFKDPLVEYENCFYYFKR